MSNKNKVGILIDRLNVGGVEKIAIEQVIALRKQGIDATLLILRKKAVIDKAFPDLINKIPIIYLDSRLPRILRFSFKFPIFHFFSSFHITYPFLLPFFIKHKEFDYLIAHGTYTAFSAIAIKKIKKIPFSVFIWDPIGYILNRVYSRKLNFLLQLFLIIAKKLDALIINQTEVILTGGEAHNVYFREINPRVKIITIPPSVYPSSNITSKKENFVLMVTAWKEGKDPGYIFKLIEYLPSMKIYMVGKWLDPVYREYFEKRVSELKLSQNISIIGAVSEDELSNYYSKALLLLQTNDDRGFGLPALEAAGHGTTFIIPKGQGVCDLFKDKYHGFFTNEKDTQHIVRILKLLLTDNDKALEMGKLAWQHVVKSYSWDKHAKKLVNLIKENNEK